MRIGLFLLLSLGISSSQAQPAPAELNDVKNRLLNDLRSKRYAERKHAVDALPDVEADDLLDRELFKTSLSADPDAAKNATKALNGRLLKAAQAAFGKLDAKTLDRVRTERGLDFYCDYLAINTDRVTQEHWATLNALAKEKLLPKIYEVNPKFKFFGDEFDKAKVVTLDYFRTPSHRGGLYKICCEDWVNPAGFIRVGVIARRQINSDLTFPNSSFLIALQSISFRVSGYCLMICDGDVELNNSSSDAVIATGKIKLGPKARHTVCFENARVSCPELRFSTLTDFGVDLKQKDRDWVFSTVNEESPFAKAGVKEGDLAYAGNDRLIAAPYDLRRAIREGCLTGKLYLAIERSGSRKDLVVPLELLPKAE